jgi:hypothetical protein
MAGCTLAALLQPQSDGRRRRSPANVSAREDPGPPSPHLPESDMGARGSPSNVRAFPQPYGSVASKAQVRSLFADLKIADLIVDAGYDGGKTDRSGDNPLNHYSITTTEASRTMGGSTSNT